eukprot:1214942-Rhodomonas_salina.1
MVSQTAAKRGDLRRRMWRMVSQTAEKRGDLRRRMLRMVSQTGAEGGSVGGGRTYNGELRLGWRRGRERERVGREGVRLEQTA